MQTRKKRPPALFPTPHPWPVHWIHPHGPVENIAPLVEAIDVLRAELGFILWADLQPWCDESTPKDAGADALERLYERLCILWANRGYGEVDL